ncbi:hypothetical protein CYMTET_8320 [Cymbomonas tetramitiformis]|uniref:Uncharacterized protein n=1 Tax=Cymbomonas tetramitiformis TaxID=36881 RepID=A0AAE0GTM9_9CHLO|nr:hypothetical protein CYMTET_8320 [Cymbomonas tetramitiformis]
MWTDTETHTAFAAITQTTCEEPENAISDTAQLYLRSDVVDFDVFPMGPKTGPNIKKWFQNVLVENKIPYSAISGVTPDGAADGHCALQLIPEISEKVNTCILHQLQRGVLYSVGLAGVQSKNPDAKSLLRKHNRVVTLSRQALAFGKSLVTAQSKAGVPAKHLLTLQKTATTRWGNQYQQLNRNCILRVAIDSELQAYKQENRQNKEAIVEANESESGSKAGTPVPASDIGLESDDWDKSQELESFLSYPFDIKETIEHSGICTASQAMILLHDLKSDFCSSVAPLAVKVFPPSLDISQRERAEKIREAEELHTVVQTARAVLRDELDSRIFFSSPF